MEEVEFEERIESLGGWAFLGCTSLKKVILPNSLLELGYMAFGDYTGLEEVKISGTVKKIPEYAFDNCTALKNVELSYGIETLGNAFRNCSSLIFLYQRVLVLCMLLLKIASI